MAAMHTEKGWRTGGAQNRSAGKGWRDIGGYGSDTQVGNTGKKMGSCECRGRVANGSAKFGWQMVCVHLPYRGQGAMKFIKMCGALDRKKKRIALWLEFGVWTTRVDNFRFGLQDLALATCGHMRGEGKLKMCNKMGGF